MSAIDLFATLLERVVRAGDARSPVTSEAARSAVSDVLAETPELGTPRLLAVLAAPRVAPGARLPAPPAMPGTCEP